MMTGIRRTDKFYEKPLESFSMGIFRKEEVYFYNMCSNITLISNVARNSLMIQEGQANHTFTYDCSHERAENFAKCYRDIRSIKFL